MAIIHQTQASDAKIIHCQDFTNTYEYSNIVGEEKRSQAAATAPRTRTTGRTVARASRGQSDAPASAECFVRQRSYLYIERT